MVNLSQYRNYKTLLTGQIWRFYIFCQLAYTVHGALAPLEQAFVLFSFLIESGIVEMSVSDLVLGEFSEITVTKHASGILMIPWSVIKIHDILGKIEIPSGPQNTKFLVATLIL